MESIAEEILREILLKVPTRDVIRCRCVRSQWRCLLTDPSFVNLYAHSPHVAGAEGLLVAQTNRAPGKNPEIVLFNLSSAMPMCRFSDLDTQAAYRAANACNGFICLVSDLQDAPVIVCNPVTGEKLQIRAPPVVEHVDWHLFAMGFSPSTRQYKLFRLTFPDMRMDDAHLDVFTFGDNAGWRRRRPGLGSSCHKMRSWPVLINGKLYVVTRPLGSGPFGTKRDVVLAIDVTSEAVRTHRLPQQHISAEKMTVDALELHGQLCVAIDDLSGPRRRLTFWVLTTMAGQNKKEDDDGHVWEPRYSFYMDAQDCSRREHYWYYRCKCHPRGAWLHDGDGVLCYLTGGHLYKYDTTVKRTATTCNKEWDHQLRLQPSDSRWNVYGGYRPSLLSPHDLASALHQHHEQPFVNPLLQTRSCK